MEYTVITGASRGIGRALAVALAKKGKNLILIARTLPMLEEVKAEILKSFTANVITIPYDLSKDLSDLRNTLSYFPVDSVILNAGFGISGEFHTHSLEREEEMIALNVKSVVSLSHFFANEFVKEKKGQITVISSVSSMIPGPYMATYYASKAYVSSFSCALSRELKPYGIPVTCCNMPRIDTDFDRTAGERHSKLIKKGKPATWAAGKIIRSMEKKKRTANIGFSTKMTAFGSRILPKSFFLWLMAKANK